MLAIFSSIIYKSYIEVREGGSIEGRNFDCHWKSIEIRIGIKKNV